MLLSCIARSKEGPGGFFINGGVVCTGTFGCWNKVPAFGTSLNNLHLSILKVFFPLISGLQKQNSTHDTYMYRCI